MKVSANFPASAPARWSSGNPSMARFGCRRWRPNGHRPTPHKTVRPEARGRNAGDCKVQICASVAIAGLVNASHSGCRRFHDSRILLPPFRSALRDNRSVAARNVRPWRLLETYVADHTIFGKKALRYFFFGAAPVVGPTTLQD